MTTLFTPPIVNDQGNINVHRSEGAIIPISLENEVGAEIDVSAMPLFFVSGTFRKALDPDPNNPEGRLLILTPTNMQDVSHGANFHVIEETIPTSPIIHWEGKIYKRG